MINDNNNHESTGVLTQNFLIVFNKKRSQNKLNKVLFKLSKRGCSYDVVDIADLSTLTKDIINKYDIVVAVGGDGTVLSTITFLSGTEGKLGIIPCGTANLFAASISVPRNMDKAIEILFNGQTKKVDLAKIGNEYFAVRVGLGYDAEIVNGAYQFLKNNLGYTAYVLQAIKQAFSSSAKKLKVTIDGRIFLFHASSVIVANAGNMFRNIFKIAPASSINDGKLDICIIRTNNLMDLVRVIWQIILGNHEDNKNVIFKQGQNIKIESKTKNNHHPVHVDGEPYTSSSIDIKVMPNCLTVMAPAS